MLCPRCDYDLTGLPSEHTCPECGCNYDEHSMEIRFTGRRNERRALMLVVPMVAIAFWIQWRRGSNGWDFLRHFIIPAGMFLGIMIRLHLRASLPTRMVLDCDGVAFLTPGQHPLRWKWGQIGCAKLGNIQSFFTIYSKDEVVLFNRYSTGLGSRKLVKRCVTEINQRIAIYAPRSIDVPSPGA